MEIMKKQVKMQIINSLHLKTIKEVKVNTLYVLTSNPLGDVSDEKFIEEHKKPLESCGLYVELKPVVIKYSNVRVICFCMKLTEKGVSYFNSSNLQSFVKENIKLINNK